MSEFIWCEPSRLLTGGLKNTAPNLKEGFRLLLLLLLSSSVRDPGAKKLSWVADWYYWCPVECLKDLPLRASPARAHHLYIC